MEETMKKQLGLVILAPAFALAWATSAQADDAFCPPILGIVTVDNVIITAPCNLIGTTVTGNVEVDPGG